MYYVNYIKNKEFCYCGVYVNFLIFLNWFFDSKYNFLYLNLEIEIDLN